MIDIKNLSYSYRRGARALDDVSARLGEGIWLLMGENGAGKTTLLHAIAGLLTPQQGECVIDGAGDTSPRRPATLDRLFLFADDMKFPAPTINGMRRIHAGFYPAFSEHRLRHNLEAFGMTGDEPLDRLSLGNRKKAQLAYTLALGTQVMLLDEPANGLDISSRRTLRRLMSESAAEGQTTVVSTHSVRDLEPLYDGVMVMSRGRMVLAMSTCDILSRLCFNIGSTAPASPLYSELDLGAWRSITVNRVGEPATDIDFTLLYTALQSPQRDAILSHLQTPLQ